MSESMTGRIIEEYNEFDRVRGRKPVAVYLGREEFHQMKREAEDAALHYTVDVERPRVFDVPIYEVDEKYHFGMS